MSDDRGQPSDDRGQIKRRQMSEDQRQNDQSKVSSSQSPSSVIRPPSSDGLIVSGARELRQRDLLARVQRAATGFDALGIGENSAVAMVLRNDFAFFEAAMAAALVGAYAVPVNWHFTAEEAGYVIADCGAKVVVVHADLLS